jgi:hypothetical protein
MVLQAHGVSMLILVLKTGQNLSIGFVPKSKAEQKNTKSEQQRFRFWHRFAESSWSVHDSFRERPQNRKNFYKPNQLESASAECWGVNKLLLDTN